MINEGDGVSTFTEGWSAESLSTGFPRALQTFKRGEFKEWIRQHGIILKSKKPIPLDEIAKFEAAQGIILQ